MSGTGAEATGDVAAADRARYSWTMRSRRVLVVLMSVLALAACGSDDGGGDAVAVEDGYSALRAAPDATEDAGPAKLHYRIEVGDRQVIEADGVVDMARQHLALELPIPGQDQALEMVIVERMLYMQLPEEGRGELGVSTPWVSVDTHRAGQAVTGITGGVGGTSDPSDALAGLRGVAEGGVRTVGTEDVRGVETTHFQADVDLRRALEASGEIRDPEAFERFADQLGGGTATYDVWLDGDGLVRKLTFATPVQQMQVSVSMELYDFGDATLPGLPAPEDVTDITDQVIAQAGQAPS